jgi:hypothetical protein
MYFPVTSPTTRATQLGASGDTYAASTRRPRPTGSRRRSGGKSGSVWTACCPRPRPRLSQEPQEPTGRGAGTHSLRETQPLVHVREEDVRLRDECLRVVDVLHVPGSSMSANCGCVSYDISINSWSLTLIRDGTPPRRRRALRSPCPRCGPCRRRGLPSASRPRSGRRRRRSRP